MTSSNTSRLRVTTISVSTKEIAVRERPIPTRYSPINPDRIQEPVIAVRQSGNRPYLVARLPKDVGTHVELAVVEHVNPSLLLPLTFFRAKWVVNCKPRICSYAEVVKRLLDYEVEIATIGIMADCSTNNVRAWRECSTLSPALLGDDNARSIMTAEDVARLRLMPESMQLNAWNLVSGLNSDDRNTVLAHVLKTNLAAKMVPGRKTKVKQDFKLPGKWKIPSILSGA